VGQLYPKLIGEGNIFLALTKYLVANVVLWGVEEYNRAQARGFRAVVDEAQVFMSMREYYWESELKVGQTDRFGRTIGFGNDDNEATFKPPTCSLFSVLMSVLYKLPCLAPVASGTGVTMSRCLEDPAGQVGSHVGKPSSALGEMIPERLTPTQYRPMWAASSN
jgi:hypothetical protein